MVATNEWTAKAQAFARWAFTPLGFLITIYGLNVIAWGGMLFLLLCNAAPAMCHPDCDTQHSSRRIWIEIDSQILNALFCVTGFGLAPWRVRDVYQWCRWRLACSPRTRQVALSRLAEIHAKWFLPPAKESNILPIASSNASTDGVTEPGKDQRMATSLWKMDTVIWGNMLNTIFQVCLAVCMWAWNRFTRPSWVTGFFVALACLSAAAAGIVMWLERRRINKASDHPGALLLVPSTKQPASSLAACNQYMQLARRDSSCNLKPSPSPNQYRRDGGDR